MAPKHRTDQHRRSIVFFSFPLGGLLLSPTTVVDVQPRRIWDLQHAVACQRFFDPPSAETRVAMLVTSHMLWCYYCCYSPRAAYILTP
jgi:hypothetical protein